MLRLILLVGRLTHLSAPHTQKDLSKLGLIFLNVA